MANPNPKTDQIEPFKWRTGESGNPKGNYKRTPHLSTTIQRLLHTPIDFKVLVEKKGKKSEIQTYQGLPVEAIVAVAIHQSMLGDKDAREWLAKHGYGTKTVHEFEDPIMGILDKYGLGGGDKATKPRPKKKAGDNARKTKAAKKRPPKNSK